MRKQIYWRQIINSITCAWKEMFSECGIIISDLIIDEHLLIKKRQIYCLEKLNSRELHNMQLLLKLEKATFQTYLAKKF